MSLSLKSIYVIWRVLSGSLAFDPRATSIYRMSAMLSPVDKDYGL